MKKLIIFITFIAACFMAVQPVQAKAKREKVLFYVYLHCDACVQKIMKNRLKKKYQMKKWKKIMMKK